MISKFIISILLISFLLPYSAFAQPPIEPPETIEEGKEAVEKGAREIFEKVPNTIKDTWQNEAIPIWQRMWGGTKEIWQKYVKQTISDFWYVNLKPKIRSFLDKTKSFLGIKIKERQEIFEEELEKEKKELAEDLPKDTEGFWQKFKSLFK